MWSSCSNIFIILQILFTKIAENQLRASTTLPCGMILARETFYGAEAIGTCAVRMIPLNVNNHILSHCNVRNSSSEPFKSMDRCQITFFSTIIAVLQNMWRMTWNSRMLASLLTSFILIVSILKRMSSAKWTATQLSFWSCFPMMVF